MTEQSTHTPYKADGTQVRKRPTQTKKADGTYSIGMGFVVADVRPDMLAAEEVAQYISDCLNALDGLNPAGVKALVASIEKLREAAKDKNGPKWENVDAAIRGIFTAYASVKGDGDV